jgi:hypothetical protein
MHPTKSTFFAGKGMVDLNNILITNNVPKFMLAVNPGKQSTIISKWFWFYDEGILKYCLFDFH